MKQNNKLSTFLLEIFVEEMPARLVNELSKQLEDNFKRGIDEHSISYSSLCSYSTPRRLIVTIEGLEKKQKDINKYMVGPPKKISLDANGNPLKPAQAFIEKNKLNIKDIEIIKKNNSEFIAANVKIVGQNTSKLLTEISHQAIVGIKNKKFMKWGKSEFQFIRPIRNLFLLFDSKFLKIDLFGIKNENKVYGHRFYDNKGKKILSFNEYFEFMKRSYVEVSFESRRVNIHNQILEIEEELGVHIPIDEELLSHVSNLTEFPKVLCGNFDREFLQIPKEVNISVMKNHQKYFPVFKDKKLANLDSRFIFVAGSPFLNKKIVITGNEKVIRARLDDAKFFYNEDRTSRLVNIQKKLESTTFIANAGSYEDKSQRIYEISLALVKMLNFEDLINEKRLEIACKLIKADLSSQMVCEFPELQGTMGKYYYKDEDSYVAEIIEQHYLPKGRSGKIPENQIAMVISIADKIDTISACFSLGLVPTGSSDPYGLRRNSIGIIRIAEGLNKQINLIEILNLSVDCFEANIKKQVGVDTRNKTIDFFVDRVKNYLTDMGYPTNIINSILNIDSNVIDIQLLKNKADLIKGFMKKDSSHSIIEADKRLKNIVKDNTSLSVEPKLLNDSFELNLYNRYNEIKSSFTKESMNNAPSSTLDAIVGIAPDLDSFFENVLVMDKNIKVKQNRINLLTNIKNLISRFVNLSEI
ncbi:glycine--tRNA ligase subunit beta [bacterium]|nr:glycine--tRNA ligase subunit beta [bacterium]